MSIPCRRARLEIALWVGDDLQSDLTEPLRRHLGECPDCREHWRTMQSSLENLRPDSVPETADSSLTDSIWPDLLPRLAQREQSWTARRFNGWLVGLAVSVACAALLFSIWRESDERPSRRSAPMATAPPTLGIGNSPPVFRVEAAPPFADNGFTANRPAEDGLERRAERE